jgi:hypothetical protein
VRGAPDAEARREAKSANDWRSVWST